MKGVAVMNNEISPLLAGSEGLEKALTDLQIKDIKFRVDEIQITFTDGSAFYIESS